MNGGKAEIAREAARCGTSVHPGQFERNQRQGHVFGAGDEAALFRVKKGGSDAALVKMWKQGGLFRRPFVRIAPALGDQPGDRPARDIPCSLDEHLQLVTIGKAPQELANIVAGQGLERRERFGFGKCFHKMPFFNVPAASPHPATDVFQRGHRQLEPIWLSDKKSC